MSKRSLTTANRDNSRPTVEKRSRHFRSIHAREKPSHAKFTNFAEDVCAELIKLGVKTYYAQLSTIDYKLFLSNDWQDRNTARGAALRILEQKIKPGYNKPMVSDGETIVAGKY